MHSVQTIITHQFGLIFLQYLRSQEHMEPERQSQTRLDEQESVQSLSQRLELEGQCKINNYLFLEFSLIKSILLFLLLAVSVVGLIFLKYYKSLRAKVFYFTCGTRDATHICIHGTTKREQEIVQLHKNDKHRYFYYKKLKYELRGDKVYPFGLNYQIFLKDRLTQEYMQKGLTSAQAESNGETFGKNQHIVDPPTYFEYLYDVMTEPFFFIQYLAAVIYIIQKMPELSILLIGASILTTSINYIILYISYRKIKEIAEVTINVSVLRNGEFLQLPSSELVPGDIFIPKDELFCDVLLLKGEVYVNQSNLTGQSIPIAKFGLDEYKNYKEGDNSKWIYEGSKILSCQNPLAMVVHTGYSSKRGRILRKILHRVPQVPHFFTTFIFFLVQLFIIGAAAYLATLWLRLDNEQLDRIVILLNFLLIVTFCFPPSTPIYFNLVYSFSLLRLKLNNILGTEPQKTVEGAHLRILCFDKTGTLTEDKVEVRRVIKFSSCKYSQIPADQRRKSLDFKLFACCHTVKEFDGKFMGDQIDLKTFLHSGYSLRSSSAASVCFEVEQKAQLNANRMQILKIYQYESRFQSMSVLAFDGQTGKYFVFVKGAPQIIHQHSITKYQYFEQILQIQSYGGFRTIGYGYKQVEACNLQTEIKASRESHLEKIEMLGLLVFENKLKADAREIMQKLQIAEIRPRMITGDSIYIAIETAMRCGILERKQEVMVLQGSTQELSVDVAESEAKFKAKFLKFQNQQVNVREHTIAFNEYMESAYSIIIDNNFLKITDHLPLSPKIKVYSRISPENKALIIRRTKQEIRKKRKGLKWLDRILSEQVDKVGMVGDGANDLLAIKQANIGIGIRNCDSSYAASFSILNLIDIDYIIRQSKCAQRSIIEICRFMCIGSFLTVPMIIIMQTEAAFFSSFHLVFNNFTKFLLIPVLISLSQPADIHTPFKPSSNFLKKQNQLVVWGNIIISSLAFAATVIFYRSTPQYVKNTRKADVNSGWKSNTDLVAAQLLYFSLQPVIMVVSLYEGSPWKQPLYKNVILFVVFLLNLGFQIAYYFIQPQLASFFDVPSISYQSLLYMFAIGGGTSLFVLLYCYLIYRMRLHEQTFTSCMKVKQTFQIHPTGSSSENERL